MESRNDWKIPVLYRMLTNLETAAKPSNAVENSLGGGALPATCGSSNTYWGTGQATAPPCDLANRSINVHKIANSGIWHAGPSALVPPATDQQSLFTNTRFAYTQSGPS